jgi:nicotinamidase-related amidase
MGTRDTLALELRRQELVRDERGRNCWKEIVTPREVPAAETALLICDMWDDHRCRAAAERVAEMAPRMNELIKAARDRGVFIIHAPSETMGVYEGTPARRRMTDAPPVEPPPDRELPNPELPFDPTKGDCDSGELLPHRPWSRQNPAVEIDQDRDGISDKGREVYNVLQQRGIRLLLIMGVHTNYCILNRTFAIKQMRRWGVDVALVRDMTDCLYDPARPPYVTHDEGTALVVGYIEKFWCPTLDSGDLV